MGRGVRTRRYYGIICSMNFEEAIERPSADEIDAMLAAGLDPGRMDESRDMD